ncbi:MAG: bifunctional precorrin-2 dehydrogenase/sirohydrochlorin ferrochelatase [Chlamydiae bacterium]|nr:bifunctional precorrin-2 dehydrogenase/sirohydrochlorin ferrochelatase [Chlamydiota bacterium]MBI3277397.1 bifunctional precorrin-2 dehydrogenase/sirohydrochlorin ferrochelatase [Chlamydiota bacterium]
MYYPVFLNLKGKTSAIFGGGPIALRKAESLIDCGSKVCVYAPEVIPEIENLAKKEKIIWEKKVYEPDDLVGVHLVIASTNDRLINAAIFREAEERGLFVNVVDDPELCNFIAPSILRRGKLVIAVSTEGASPAMAKKIRQDLELEFGPEYALFLKAMESSRKDIQERLPKEEQRREFFTQLVHSNILEQIRLGLNANEIQKVINQKIEKFLCA